MLNAKKNDVSAVPGEQTGGEIMSTKSNDQGRAYEFAWMTALFSKLASMRRTSVIENSSWYANKRAWDSVTQSTRDIFEVSAAAAVDAILDLEPRMEENDADTLLLEFQKDEVGESGDFRDILIRRDAIAWEVGLSIKHNHDAVKHSRLSHVLDFGAEWYQLSCSQHYWNEIRPVFDMLNYEKSRGTNWNQLSDKENDVYVPLLTAFLNEVNRAYQYDRGVAIRMFEYLVGIKDYHKIVSDDNRCVTLIHTFNLNGTLSQPSRIKVSAFNVPVVELPTEIIRMQFKPGSNTTVQIYMDNGWAFSFRIHSASTKVQPSLKFDVQFISAPASVLHIECRWHRR